ncbi:MAG: hypothetical protein JNM68_09170 [Dinghuibacter sp.]|nr:hypothetical protein [Dinghuibacter sp.]
MAKAKPTPAKKKAAAKPAATKKAVKKTIAPKVPFYAQLLSKQESAQLKATNKENDAFQTEKYPNDEADVIYKQEAGQVYTFAGAVTSKKKDQVVVTLKYPSDNDEAVTLKYPSDDDEVILSAEKLKEANLRTTRYPNDEYAQASDYLLGYKEEKGRKAKPTSKSKDTITTMKYPSDTDEEMITLKYPSDKDESWIS